MKTISTFAVLFLLVQTSLAQPEKGKYIIGGTSSFGYSANRVNDNINSLNFSIQPQFGKFISDKTVLYGGLGYQLRRQRNQNLITSSQGFSATFGFTRFRPLVNGLYLTLDGRVNAGYNYSSNPYTTDGYYSAGIAFSPGLAYFLNDRWMIYSNIGSLYYNYYTEPVGNFNNEFGYSFRANNFSVGARFILGKKK